MTSRKIHGAKIRIHIAACNSRDGRLRTSRSRRNRETRPQLRLASVPPPFIAEGDWANDTDLGKTFPEIHDQVFDRRIVDPRATVLFGPDVVARS
jgi:hypothetical protein